MNWYSRYIGLAIAGVCMQVQACRVLFHNDTDINVLVKDQEVAEVFVVQAGASQAVGNTHRRPTMVIFMQVDRYENAPYKREFVVKQIACSGDKSKPVSLALSQVIEGSLDTKLFQRSELANTHKKLAESARSCGSIQG